MQPHLFGGIHHSLAMLWAQKEQEDNVMWTTGRLTSEWPFNSKQFYFSKFFVDLIFFFTANPFFSKYLGLVVRCFGEIVGLNDSSLTNLWCGHFQYSINPIVSISRSLKVNLSEEKIGSFKLSILGTLRQNLFPLAPSTT